MKKYKNTHELYRSVFDEVHASDELLRKVENMSQIKSVKKFGMVKKAAMVAAVVGALLVTSNAVAFAATGSTWVEQIAVHVNYNGNDQEINVQKSVSENGDVQYQFDLDDLDENGDGIKQSFALNVEGDDEIKDGDTLEIQNVGANPTIAEENGRVIFEWSAMDFKKDITDDFSDGKAEIIVPVTYDDDSDKESKNGEIVVTVEGTVESFKVSYSSK